MLKEFCASLDNSGEIDKKNFVDDITLAIGRYGYKIAEINADKPWGAYIRFDNDDAEKFVNEFFEDTTINEAKLGNDDAELSPKILIVSPKQRLSWQKHFRRAERWKFLTPGGYYKSQTDDQGDLNLSTFGDVVQFEQGERHRLVGDEEKYTLVAEIWQHVDPKNLSDEDDIVRIEDDYIR